MIEGVIGLSEKPDNSSLLKLVLIPKHFLYLHWESDKKQDENLFSGPWPHWTIMMDTNDAHNYRL